MTVSKQTENFIDCMKTMQELYTKVYKSLNEIYNVDDTDASFPTNSSWNLTHSKSGLKTLSFLP